MTGYRIIEAVLGVGGLWCLIDGRRDDAVTMFQFALMYGILAEVTK